VDEFPDVRADVEGFRGLPYIQVGVLADLAQRAKGAADWDTYSQIVNLVNRFLDGADSELSNAIHVSILEHLDFIGPRGMSAWQLMPPELQAAWRSIMECNERLLGHPRPEGRVKPWEQPPNLRQTVATRRFKQKRARGRG
jgi:hypothetical protein